MGGLPDRHPRADPATVGRAADRQPVTPTAAPRLRLAEALLAEYRGDEAELVLAPLAARREPEAIAALASLCAAQGRMEEAVDRATDALSSPHLSSALVAQLASVLARAQRYDLADNALAAAIEAGDASLELRIARARIAEERGRTDLALQH